MLKSPSYEGTDRRRAAGPVRKAILFVIIAIFVTLSNCCPAQDGSPTGKLVEVIGSTEITLSPQNASTKLERLRLPVRLGDDVTMGAVPVLRMTHNGRYQSSGIKSAVFKNAPSSGNELDFLVTGAYC